MDGAVAELVVRILEKPRALELRQSQLDAEFFHRRRLDCFDRQAVLFVDTSSARWSCLFCNEAFSQVAVLLSDAALHSRCKYRSISA